MGESVERLSTWVTGRFGPETDPHWDTSALFRWVRSVRIFRHQYRSVQKTYSLSVELSSPMVRNVPPYGPKSPQSCPWVHFVWPNPTQPTSWLTQPNPLQVEKFGPNPTQPNTTNNRAYSLVVTYFYTQNWSVSGTSQIGREIKFNCLVKSNLI